MTDFVEDPFKDYRYEDPFNIDDPFADTQGKEKNEKRKNLYILCGSFLLLFLLNNYDSFITGRNWVELKQLDIISK